MTLKFECDWCGEESKYYPDEVKTLTFDGVDYQYCKKCVADVRIALAAGKDGEQGNYPKVVHCWTELLAALDTWCRGPKISIAHWELRHAIEKFNKDMREIKNETTENSRT